MIKTIHEIHPDIANPHDGKAQLMHCRICNTITLHETPFFGYPFRCVANHGGKTICDSCNTFVEEIAKVIVSSDKRYECFCSLCCEPDSDEKQQRIEERRRQAAEYANKPIDLSDPESVARAFGGASLIKS